jgi:hypothetical protein
MEDRPHRPESNGDGQPILNNDRKAKRDWSQFFSLSAMFIMGVPTALMWGLLGALALAMWWMFNYSMDDGLGLQMMAMLVFAVAVGWVCLMLPISLICHVGGAMGGVALGYARGSVAEYALAALHALFAVLYVTLLIVFEYGVDWLT